VYESVCVYAGEERERGKYQNHDNAQGQIQLNSFVHCKKNIDGLT